MSDVEGLLRELVAEARGRAEAAERTIRVLEAQVARLQLDAERGRRFRQADCQRQRLRRSRHNLRRFLELRPVVLERDGHKCMQCGAVDHVQVDHIVPVALGGGDELSNLQALCRRCNSSKGAR